jgi:hypothetical protein
MPRINHVYVWLISFGLLAACGQGSILPVTSQSEELQDRTCTKDLALVRQIIEQTAPSSVDLNCATDDNCPCGSFCENSFCTARCITTDDADYACYGVGEICTNYGRCEVPSAPPPEEVLSLSATPSNADVSAPPAGSPFPETIVQVALTGDATPPSAPRIFVSGATTLAVTCPGGQAECENPGETRVNELEVKCGPAESFGSQCVLDTWSFVATDGGKRAVREVRVRPKAGSAASVWELRLTGDGRVAADQSVFITRRGTQQPLDGSYTGRLVLVRTPDAIDQPPTSVDAGPPPTMAPSNLVVKVDALVKGNNILVSDPTRIMSPTGKIRLGAPGSFVQQAWLATGSNSLVGKLTSGARVHDPQRGTLNVRFTMALPIYDAQSARSIDGVIELTRTGDVVAPVCGTGNTCQQGFACDTTLMVCVPGPAFAPVTTAVANGLVFDTMWSWYSAVSAKLGSPSSASGPNDLLGMVKLNDSSTGQVIERLQCYRNNTVTPWNAASSPVDAVFGLDVLARTGDFSCAGPLSGGLPLGLPILNRIDAAGAGAAASNDTVSDLLTACLSEMGQQAPAAGGAVTLGEGKCVSPARVLSSIALAIGREDWTYVDRHVASLLQHLVRGWITAGGFSAQQGLELLDIGDASPAVTDQDPAALLDTFEKAWGLVTDGSVAKALLTLSPMRLTSPDYRGTNTPRIYWPFSNTDVQADHHTLTAQADCGGTRCQMDAATIDPHDIDLGGDLTVAFELDDTVGSNVEREIIDSPWISVSVKTANDIIDRGYKRAFSVVPGKTVVTTEAGNWDTCRAYCANSTVPSIGGACRVWSYQQLSATTGNCYMSSDLGVRVAAGGWSSGVLTEQPRTSPADGVIYDNREINVDRSGGVLLQTRTNVVFLRDCVDACFATSGCAFYSFDDPQGTCKLMTSQATTKTTRQGFVSGAMPTTTVKIGYLGGQHTLNEVSFVVPRAGDVTATKRHFVITRTTSDHKLHLYVDGQQFQSAPFLADIARRPLRGAPARMWVGRRSDRIASHVAVWDTALDGWEAQALFNRAILASGANLPYVTRKPLALPTGDAAKDHDQRSELSVTMLESLVPQLRLLGAYLNSVQGKFYTECLAGNETLVREPVQQRFGRTLRTALYVEELAGRLHDRARQAECDSDSDCPGSTTCGNTFRQSYDAFSAERTGLMQPCNGLLTYAGGNGEGGMCVPRAGLSSANGGLGGNGTSTPGAVGTLRFDIQVPATGSYAIWARSAIALDARSFWLRVDGGAWQEVYGTWFGTPYQWVWLRSNFVQLSAGAHSVTIGVKDDGAVLRDIVVSSDLFAAPDNLRNVCYLNGKPLLRAAISDAEKSAQKAWEAAQRDLDSSIQQLTEQSARMGSCKNPLGIENGDLPLVFAPYTRPGDPPGALYFAASLYLNSVASSALAGAKTAYDTVIVDWQALQSAKFQAQTQGLANEARIAAIAARYDSQLSELCGVSTTTTGGLLAQMLAGERPIDTCFVKPTTACQTNLGRPIKQADASCYTGAIGQAILGMKTSHLSIESARINWQSKQDSFGTQGKMCAELQNTADIIRKHNEHMEALRRKKSWFDKVSGGISLIASIPTGMGALAAADAASKVFNEAAADGSTGDFLGVCSGALSLFGKLSAGAEIADEQAKFDAEMLARKNTIDIMQCFATADRLRDEIQLSAIAIAQATSEFEQAAMALSSRRARLNQLVAEGRAEIARESERSIGLPYHHYWLDRDIQVYKRQFAWAKRAMYLYVRAVEYDKQQSLGLRARVLDARNLPELKAIFDVDMPPKLTNNQLGPFNVSPQPRAMVFSAREVMGIPGSDTQSLGRYLSSPASFFYGPNNELIGRGIRFSMTPTSSFLQDTTVPSDCAEHATRFTGSLQISGVGAQMLSFELWQSNTFSSQRCGPAGPDGVVPFVTSSHYPERNLFDETAESLTNPSTMKAAVVQNLTNLDESHLFTSEPAVSSGDLLGRGLYGDYVLVIRSNVANAINLASLTDILIRVDYTAGANGAAPQPH